MPDHTSIASHIQTWYQTHQRDLPWRKTRDPYRIWVSEIMLQQTQVSRVKDYYKRFLEKFPTVTQLAHATWDQFLPYWQGLGFYSRGRNMLKTAQIIVEKYNSIFPTDRSELQSLPGIAQYTSAAILSFAHEHTLPALDTNLRRVLQRVYGCTEKGVEPRANALFEQAVHNSIKSSTINHALMDLGATICKSRKVQCHQCPLQTHCHFLQSGKKEQWESTLLSAPKKRIRSQKIPMEVAVACIHQNGKYLIAQRKKDKGSAWEFPGGKREKGEDWRHCLQREIREELGIEISVRPHFFEEVWEEKQYFWRLRFSRCQILKGTPKLTEHQQLKWVTPSELTQYDFPTANQKALQKLITMRMPKSH